MNKMSIVSNELSLYQRGKDFLWTDPYISKQMLKHHLNLSSNAASRNIEAIDATIRRISEWIPPESSIVDLGCGPGLYTERLHAMGYHVTGIDISNESIVYARASAERQRMDIDYYQQNYLTDALPGTFDAALCIYADFGALTPAEQTIFLRNVEASLSEGGIIIFDVFNESYNENRSEERTWGFTPEADFWTDEEHFLLHDKVYYPTEQTWGTRYIVITHDEVKEYITWDTLYDRRRIEELLAEHNFNVDTIDEEILKDSSVMLVKALKA